MIRHAIHMTYPIKRHNVYKHPIERQNLYKHPVFKDIILDVLYKDMSI